MVNNHQKAYRKAILRLIKLVESDSDLAFILAALRGPDIDDFNGELKAKYTAPIRLYVLGPTAYRERGFEPYVDNVNLDLPFYVGLWTEGKSHFLSHINRALFAISKSELPCNED